MTNRLRYLALVPLMLIALLGTTAAAAQDTFVPNIVDIAAADDRFETLHTAIVAAGLADALAAEGANLTVFAPTDDAFAKVPAETLNSLLADPQGALTQVLLYHAVAGQLDSSAVLAAASLPTLQGQSLNVSLRDSLPFVNDSQIVITDIQAKNGIIHVIDTVLIPDLAAPATAAPATAAPATAAPATAAPAAAAPAAAAPAAAAPAAPSAPMVEGSIVDIAVANGNFETLVAAASAAGLAETLAGPGDFTIFAPTDTAFAALPAGTVEALLADPEGDLKTILLFHVVGDSLSRDQLATDTYVPTLDGRPLFVNRDGSTILDISGAQLLLTDIQASNGVIHVIDRVLMP